MEAGGGTHGGIVVTKKAVKWWERETNSNLGKGEREKIAHQRIKW